MINIKDLSRPELPKQDNYERALNLAMEAFSRKDPARVAAKAGAGFENGRIRLPHLNKTLALDCKTHEFRLTQGSEDSEAPIWLAILAAHYLNSAPGITPSGRLKHFREFKEGHFYEPAFNRRTKDILIQVYGNDPEGMIHAAKKLGAQILGDGDASAKLSYFPYLPITCILWKGDEEFPPDATALFDETADRFFSAEDMAVAGQMAILELLKAGRQ
jgi:hypothetical protein